MIFLRLAQPEFCDAVAKNDGEVDLGRIRQAIAQTLFRAERRGAGGDQNVAHALLAEAAVDPFRNQGLQFRDDSPALLIATHQVPDGG
jgi:hypothetical protein